MERHVVVANAEREIDGIEIFERRRKKRKVKREETARRGVRPSARRNGVTRGSSGSPSFRLPNR